MNAAPDATPLDVPTEVGLGRAHYFEASAARALLLLSHGAGTGIGTIDLQGLAAGLPTLGYTVVLFEQPWVIAGKKLATPPATLDIGLLAAIAAVTHSHAGLPLVVGGRSAGARSACRVVNGSGARACLALSFPLHPPGRPEKSRLDELLSVEVPTLVVQGTSDAFGGPGDFPGSTKTRVVMPIERGDHSFKVPKSAGRSVAEVQQEIVAGVGSWLAGIETDSAAL